MVIKALLEAERKCKEFGECKGELCTCEIPKLIGRTQSNISMHLAKLEHWGIIKIRKEGKMRLYSIENDKSGSLWKFLKNNLVITSVKTQQAILVFSHRKRNLFPLFR